MKNINHHFAFIGLVLLLFLSGFQNPKKLIVGKWKNSITVPPSNQPYENMMTFSGRVKKGTFLDQNNHTGSWWVKGDSITWVYEGVPDLTNTFIGKVSADGQSMEGVNYGIWQGEEFRGSWMAKRE